MELDHKFDVNDDYEYMLDLDYLDEKLNQESDEVLKNFYLLLYYFSHCYY